MLGYVICYLETKYLGYRQWVAASEVQPVTQAVIRAERIMRFDGRLRGEVVPVSSYN
jgi:hypothetical protein